MAKGLRSIYDILDDQRLRRDWLRKGGTLDVMEGFLSGYSTALQIHGVAESFELDPVGAFNNWLSWKFGTSLTAGWATAVESLTQDHESSLEAFFRLLDAFREDLKNSTLRA